MDFKEAIASEARWTLNGCYNFLKEESQLKKLMLVARYDSFNANNVVTVADNGTLRAFTVTGEKVERTSKLPDFCKDWKIQTGGRTGINYRKGGFAPENGFKRQGNSGEGPVAKRQWGHRDNDRQEDDRRGHHRGHRGNRRR